MAGHYVIAGKKIPNHIVKHKKEMEKGIVTELTIAIFCNP